MLYELTRIDRILGGRKILDNASLAIRARRIYSLSGPNGAGKTTLLKILAFLEMPNAGEIYFHAKKVENNEKDLLALRRQVVFVDQTPLLFTGTVEKNVEFGLRMRKIPAPERKKRVREVLEQVGMTSFLQADAHRLSGGETKRVALARALAVRPRVLLCDEPTANVDQENQQIILDILAGINRIEGTSIIFSTHYLSQEQQLAHHSLHIQHGHISEMMAGNIFRAELIRSDEQRSWYRLAGCLDISLPNHEGGDDPVLNLSIDSTKILFVGENHADRDGTLVEGRVTRTEQSNGKVRVDIDAGIPLAVYLAAESYQYRPILLEERLKVFLPDAAVSCISADSDRS